MPILKLSLSDTTIANITALKKKTGARNITTVIVLGLSVLDMVMDGETPDQEEIREKAKKHQI